MVVELVQNSAGQVVPAITETLWDAVDDLSFREGQLWELWPGPLESPATALLVSALLLEERTL